MDAEGERLSPLASVRATRAVLEAHGLATKKALGQHFLINEGVVRRICDVAELSCEDDILEVGPGIGTLTVALLHCARRVAAIERDVDLPAVLAETCDFAHDRFELIRCDALSVGPDDLSFAPNKLVANLPYAVAATLVLDVFKRFNSIQSATVMVQSEVAERMAAHPGTKNYGAFTVKLALFAHSVSRFTVAPTNFFPPPRVQSTVIRLDRAGHDDLSPDERRCARMMADAAFATRRKTVANSCRAYFAGRVDAASIDQVLAASNINPRRRGESLSLEEFKCLGKQAYKMGLLSRQ